MSRNTVPTLDICSSDAVKEWIGESSADRDSLITTTIERVSMWFEEETGRIVKTDDYEGLYRGTGESFILSRHFPVHTVAKIEIRSAGPDDWIEETAEQLALLDTEDPNGTGFLYWAGRVFPFSEDRFNVRLTVNAGLGTQPSALPRDLIQMGCIGVELLLKYQDSGTHVLSQIVDSEGAGRTFRGASSEERGKIRMFSDVFNRYRTRPFG